MNKIRMTTIEDQAIDSALEIIQIFVNEGYIAIVEDGMLFIIEEEK